jgi:catechol 2,3-dioxygenase-like lactoylglutathione lyase family enzyme
VKVGVLASGDTAVRAAHSLSAHDTVEEVVVVGPARSRSFRVVPDASECDLLIGSGDAAPARAQKLGVRLVWDGDNPAEGVVVWGASPVGLALALGAREPDPRIIAVAHPDLEEGFDHQVRFPDPVGSAKAADTTFGGRHVALAQSPARFAACLAVGSERQVTIVDDGAFMSGIALAAAVDIVTEDVAPVWDSALVYLQTAAVMGLVMAEDR